MTNFSKEINNKQKTNEIYFVGIALKNTSFIFFRIICLIWIFRILYVNRIYDILSVLDNNK